MMLSWPDVFSLNKQMNNSSVLSMAPAAKKIHSGTISNRNSYSTKHELSQIS